MRNVLEVIEELEADEESRGGAGELLKIIDQKMLEAARTDLNSYLSNVLTSLIFKDERGAHSTRTFSILSALGWLDVNYPYRRNEGGFQRLAEKLGLSGKDTAAARECEAKCGALGGSFKEGRETLQTLTGIRVSVSKLRNATLEFGQSCLEELNEAQPDIRTYKVKPAGAKVRTIRTLFCMADGSGVPCTSSDTKGIKGKDGKAGTRSIRVVVFGEYEWLDETGRPVPYPDSYSYGVSIDSMKETTGLIRRLGMARGYGTVPRVQCVADGEEAIESALRQAFPDAIFTNDIMHACDHLHSCCTHINLPDKEFRFLRGLLRRHGAKSAVKRLMNNYAEPLTSNPNAFKEINYLKKRIDNMHYGIIKKEGLFIASGHVEAGIRVIVARRCKQAGMHWRHKNAFRICAIHAYYRSNRNKAA